MRCQRGSAGSGGLVRIQLQTTLNVNLCAHHARRLVAPPKPLEQAQPVKKIFIGQLILCQTSISFAQSIPEWTPVKKLNAGSFYCG